MPSSSSFSTTGLRIVLASHSMPRVRPRKKVAPYRNGVAEQRLEVDDAALAYRDADEQRQEQRCGHRKQQAQQRADDDREDQLLARA